LNIIVINNCIDRQNAIGGVYFKIADLSKFAFYLINSYLSSIVRLVGYFFLILIAYFGDMARPFPV
tara:strand:- start:588 stop:785 length:198 start_codon:yes stop_codon:yes gene_type:complete